LHAVVAAPRDRRIATVGAFMPRPSRAIVKSGAACIVLILTAVWAGIGSAPASGDLSGRASALQAKERAQRAASQYDSHRISHFQGSIAALQAREDGLQRSLDIQRRILAGLRTRLRADRARLMRLRRRLAHDRTVLARQLRAVYETPPPDIVNVVLDAHGFAELLERVDQLRAIGHRNAQVTSEVAKTRTAVARQTRRLTADERNQRQVTAAALSERDQVSQVRVALVARQMVYVRARSRHSARLATLGRERHTLERQIAKQNAAAAAAQSSAYGGPTATPPPGAVGAFGSHDGTWGFFPAPGTNYGLGAEPAIAARLDRLGKSLHLHLVGLSGYRTPQHSVEVGGFANDPHTLGQASDTPGVEGVSEATLEAFGLTRPFGGPAEANHIQLHG
jgi:peptidoglycan hydrolase CwlO-like protein